MPERRLGLVEGRQFRAFYNSSVVAGTPRIIKFTAAIPFELLHQKLACHVGDVSLNVIVVPTTDTGTYPLTIAPVGKNRLSTRPQDPSYYATQIGLTCNEGGTGAITGGTTVETLRCKTATATGQQTSVGDTAFSTRMLPAGTYYLVFTSASGTSEFTYSLEYEDLPGA